ncbi:uncharacterized protein E0L32_007237 [Thyridium curvatum]|uniref:Alcohol dehydrogenase n=1 Tax=Thyridium curvatum TaxID=1093900 RepID=A0A507AQ72_9PEZI|nr:uncharacterized protein E0L32_007237 [Thyridium curvatum]TPX12122.1 hypothetical protein E0L32_007237 [Thyridium curvatum]
MATQKTMKAVVFGGVRKVSVEDRPVPQRESPPSSPSSVHVQDEKDVILKVHATALCGSELHTYRGLDPHAAAGFIMGHEFTGEVVEAGSAVKTLEVGDKVVVPFTTSCGECFYCKLGASARCANGLLFGCAKLDGGQAEYVRVPLADGTAVKAPAEVDDRALILMGDIFPTGFFGARNAFRWIEPQRPSDATVVVIGCGPVGLCAIVAALEYKPRHLFAVDSVESRLELARGLGAEPLNFMTDAEGMRRRVLEVTEGRGADAVVEVVGLTPAMRTAYDLIRPFGVISSIGVHHGEIPFHGDDGYNKNVRLLMGRCPVRSIFPDALKVLAKQQHLFSFMFEKITPLSDAVEAYDLFDKMKVQKIVFTP